MVDRGRQRVQGRAGKLSRLRGGDAGAALGTARTAGTVRTYGSVSRRRALSAVRRTASAVSLTPTTGEGRHIGLFQKKVRSNKLGT